MNNCLIFIKLLVILFIIYAVLVYKLILYKKIIKQKNIQLMKFYLDMKFLEKNLYDCFQVNDNLLCCNKLIDNIKIYYTLEDLLIIDLINKSYDTQNLSLQSKIISYIAKNIERIEYRLKQEVFLEASIEYLDTEYILHISAIKTASFNNGLVVCIESKMGLLTQFELHSLRNSINLLKVIYKYV